jgi:eukaryotic-like serine/threonine-protein kinase
LSDTDGDSDLGPAATVVDIAPASLPGGHHPIGPRATPGERARPDASVGPARADEPDEAVAPGVSNTADGTDQLPGRPSMPDGSTVDSGASQVSSALAWATSPAQALLHEEIQRTRAFLAAVWLIGLGVLGALLLAGGSRPLKWVVAGTTMSFLAMGEWLRRELRDPAKYSSGRAILVASWSGVAASSGVLFWGIFSAGPAVIVLGLYFFCRNQSRAGPLAIYLECAVLQATFAALIITGTIDDPGLFPARDQARHELIGTQILVQILYLVAFVMARSTRRMSLEAIQQLQGAVQQVRQREALLQEARQDLDRALQIGGPGRYSDLVLGSFKLGPVIGRGAMGEVYEASHTETRQVAAVKLLHPHLLANADHVARFLREARATGSLRTPHVVTIYEVSPADSPLPHLAMERLHGRDLAYHLRRKRRLSLREACEMIAQLATVIDAAAAQGIVHRDIKPQNIFLADQGSGPPVWKLLDFGVSKLADQSGTLTQGQVVGTPIYMAPEQASGDDVDYRADIYSLSAITYRAITGQPPFSGKDIPTILYSVVYSMPPRPTDLVEVPSEVDDVLAVGLAKDRELRFASGAALADALRAASQYQSSAGVGRQAAAAQAQLAWGGRR